ncbi:hypothetical protein Goklo_024689 [Gossypium klotzschianum]|uniref:Uncharacterized protein n=1 Tax=Gossypium klotzschianum TaxID=34286 RepID=A0A7J8WDT0_9ROSI|nr:hypothetical protein [Gossypium klotzschianum]
MDCLIRWRIMRLSKPAMEICLICLT